MDSGPIANACFLPTSSVVDIVTRQGTGRTGIQIPAGDFSTLTDRLYWLWGPRSFLFMGTGVLLRIEAGGTSVRPLTSI